MPASGSRTKQPKSEERFAGLSYSADFEKPDWRTSTRQSLVQWFASNARTMPWRSDPTPYHVWVSEIMLQQTQVATVIPYFERFVRRFPDVRSLAEAPIDELLGMWEGLGYYRRARSMHAAAQEIVDRFDGTFPSQPDDVLSLPGIGRYTMGAILSISADQRLPILEGNTVRVFARWIGLQEPTGDRISNELLWHVATMLISDLPEPDQKRPDRNRQNRSRQNPNRQNRNQRSETSSDAGPDEADPREARAGIINQAAMELGALICRPKTPACPACPMATCCRAHLDGQVDVIPGKVKKIQYQDRNEFAFVIRHPKRNAFLMRRRGPDERWAGLWDWPRPLDRVFAGADEAGRAVVDELGFDLRVGKRLHRIKHGVTKYRIRLDVHEAELAAPPPRLAAPWKWCPAGQATSLAMPVTARQIWEKIHGSAAAESASKA
ncbi:MAG: A/G-specific adenine glycosylase [Planctomycetota bacterium]